MKLTDALNDLDLYQKETAKTYDVMIREVLPRAILDYDRLLKDERFSLQRLPEIIAHTDSVMRFENINPLPPVPSDRSLESKNDRETTAVEKDNTEFADISDDNSSRPVTPMANNTIKGNQKLMELNDTVRKQFAETIETLKQIQLGIIFAVPNMEAGNNFGVDVQNEALKEVNTLETKANDAYRSISNFSNYRAQLVWKCVKYPQVEDCRLAVLERDERHLIDLRYAMLTMRNKLAALHNTLTKNVALIKQPRTARIEIMY